LRELLLLFLVFFLVAMCQVYHCVPAQFIFTAEGILNARQVQPRLRYRVTAGSRRRTPLPMAFVPSLAVQR
jgi:hypothetical protein